jgi:hypothetical protein
VEAERLNNIPPAFFGNLQMPERRSVFEIADL